MWSTQLQRWIPRMPDALAFTGGELSTMWAQHLERAHSGVVTDVGVVCRGPSVAFECTAARLTELGYAVNHSPDRNLGYPPGCSHTGVLPPSDIDRNSKNRLRVLLAESMVHVPESGEITLTKPDDFDT